MQKIKYILVDDSAVKNSLVESYHRHFTHIGHCIVCSTCPKFKVPGSKERQALIDNLVRLRQHHPDATILGLSELDTTSTFAPVRVNHDMNCLRRELSDSA